MRKIFVTALIAVFLAASAGAASAAFRVGGNWLTEGEGFGEWDPIRLELHDKGTLTFLSEISGDYELITGYEMYGKLEVTNFGIKVWDDYDSHTYDYPILVPLNFNPSMSNPFVLPPIKFKDLTYTISFTDVTSGTVSVHGFVDVDTIGTCEVKGDNVIWKEGSEKPDTPNTSSGCAVGGAGAFALFMAALCLSRLGKAEKIK